MVALKKYSLVAALVLIVAAGVLWWFSAQEAATPQPASEGVPVVAPEDQKLLQDLQAATPTAQEQAVIAETLRTFGLSNAEIAEGIADACKVSVQPEQVESLLARLARYGRISGEDVAFVAEAVRKNGLAGYVAAAQERFQLSRQEAIDMLCAAAYTTAHYVAPQSQTRAVKEALLALDTDLDELTTFVSQACSKSLKKEAVYSLLQALPQGSINLAEIRSRQWTPESFFGTLAEIFSSTPEEVRSYVCSGA